MTTTPFSMIRGLLGIGFEPAKVSASRVTGPLVDPLSRSGWTGNGTPKRAATTIATIDFGEASGLYDFTDNQWPNQLRLRRIVIRGSHGEIADDTVVRLAGERTIVKSSIIRSQLGYDLNLDGYDTEHISFDGEVVYRNAYLGLRLMDEEIALASLLTATGAWARGSVRRRIPWHTAARITSLALRSMSQQRLVPAWSLLSSHGVGSSKRSCASLQFQIPE